MNTTRRELMHSLVMAALAILITVSLFWWVYALSNGIFALAPFFSLLAGLTVAGITGKEADHE